jgi:hypothetical protein
VLAAAERLVFGNVSASPLFMVENKEMIWDDPLNEKNMEWKNPWALKDKSNKSFIELMNDAKLNYIKLLVAVGNEIIDEKVDFAFLDDLIGNDSYHSGLDCSIPS